jgi:hypothetical protein
MYDRKIQIQTLNFLCHNKSVQNFHSKVIFFWEEMSRLNKPQNIKFPQERFGELILRHLGNT